MDRRADQKSRLRIVETQHLGQRRIGGQRNCRCRSQNHQRQRELRLVDPFAPDHTIQRQRGRRAADRGRAARQQPHRCALPGGPCRQQCGNHRRRHHQRKAEKRHRPHRGHLHRCHLKAEQHDPHPETMARCGVQPRMGARIASREIERKPDQQTGKDDRDTIILAEPRGSGAGDNADRQAGHKPGKRLARRRRGRRGRIGQHDFPEQIARIGIKVRPPLVHHVDLTMRIVFRKASPMFSVLRCHTIRPHII